VEPPRTALSERIDDQSIPFMESETREQLPFRRSTARRRQQTREQIAADVFRTHEGIAGAIANGSERWLRIACVNSRDSRRLIR
jgi:hypothetical protein